MVASAVPMIVLLRVALIHCSSTVSAVMFFCAIDIPVPLFIGPYPHTSFHIRCPAARRSSGVVQRSVSCVACSPLSCATFCFVFASMPRRLSEVFNSPVLQRHMATTVKESPSLNRAS